MTKPHKMTKNETKIKMWTENIQIKANQNMNKNSKSR